MSSQVRDYPYDAGGATWDADAAFRARAGRRSGAWCFRALSKAADHALPVGVGLLVAVSFLSAATLWPAHGDRLLAALVAGSAWLCVLRAFEAGRLAGALLNLAVAAAVWAAALQGASGAVGWLVAGFLLNGVWGGAQIARVKGKEGDVLAGWIACHVALGAALLLP